MHPSGVTESQSQEVIASQSVPGWSSTQCFTQSYQKLAWLATAP